MVKRSLSLLLFGGLLVSSSTAPFSFQEIPWKRVTIGAAITAITAIGAKYAYDYFTRERTHEEELAYCQELCAASEQAFTAITTNYAQMCTLLSLNRAELEACLKPLILTFAVERPYLIFNEQLSKSIAKLSEFEERLAIAKKDLALRKVRIKKDSQLEDAARQNLLQELDQAESCVIQSKNMLQQLLGELSALQRTVQSFTEYMQQDMLQRIEKLEYQIQLRPQVIYVSQPCFPQYRGCCG